MMLHITLGKGGASPSHCIPPEQDRGDLSPLLHRPPCRAAIAPAPPFPLAREHPPAGRPSPTGIPCPTRGRSFPA